MLPFPRSWQASLVLILFLFMYFPIAVLGIYSFNASRYSSLWEGFSLKWYRQLFLDDRIRAALGTSLVVAAIAVLISAVLGTLMAVGLAKYHFPGKTVYRGIGYLPLIVPDIAIAVATLVFLSSMGRLYFGIQLSLWTIIAAHIVFCLAYIAVVVSSRLAGVNPHWEEAALDLGATPLQAFTQVLLPELLPGILAGCLLAFVLSMDDLLISSFTAGNGASTLPMEIYGRVRTGMKPDINALSVVLILTSGMLAFVAEYWRNSFGRSN